MTAIPGGEGRALSSNAFDGGVVLLTQEGVQAYGLDPLDDLWTSSDFEGARTVTAVDGGVVVLGPGGISWLRAPG